MDQQTQDTHEHERASQPSTAEDVGAAIATGVKVVGIVTEGTHFWRWVIIGIGFCFGVIPGILLLIYFAIEDNRRQQLAGGYVAPGETIEQARWYNERQREREREGR